MWAFRSRKDLVATFSGISARQWLWIPCWGQQIFYCLIYMGVSVNGGTPKSSILIGFSIINHPFWGTPNFWNPMYIYIYFIHVYIYIYLYIYCFWGGGGAIKTRNHDVKAAYVWIPFQRCIGYVKLWNYQLHSPCPCEVSMWGLSRTIIMIPIKQQEFNGKWCLFFRDSPWSYW